MKHKIIKTDHYLLIIDDSTINLGDFITDGFYVWKWDVDDGVHFLYDKKKVLAHLPLNTSPRFNGLDVLPPLDVVEDNYTEDDMRKMFNMGYSTSSGMEEVPERVMKGKFSRALEHIREAKWPVGFERDMIKFQGDVLLGVYVPRTQTYIAHPSNITIWAGKYTY
jgi:hypothetical protein